MTSEEALEVLGYLLGHEKAVDSGEMENVQNCLNSQEQEALKVILSEFRELKEKATAKKPIVEEVFKANYSCKTYRCPTCKQKLVSKIDGSWCGGALSRNCMCCGQKLLWD